MWYPMRAYTLEEARQFLRDDFAKVLRRTKYLYVEVPQLPDVGPGFFEPILLCSCWCDFLGALYAGDAKMRNSARIRAFIDDVLSQVNPRYRIASTKFAQIYRNGMVHAYAPAGAFSICLSDRSRHLTTAGELVIISLEHLISDMIAAVELFAVGLHDTPALPARGSLGAFNHARTQMGRGEHSS